MSIKYESSQEEDEVNIADYDYELGLAISESLTKKPGHQILTPKEVQKRVAESCILLLKDEPGGI